MYWTDYPSVVKHVTDFGFTKAAGVYASNMDGDMGFSHNMEWVVGEALDAVTQVLTLLDPSVVGSNPKLELFIPTY